MQTFTFTTVKEALGLTDYSHIRLDPTKASNLPPQLREKLEEVGWDGIRPVLAIDRRGDIILTAWQAQPLELPAEFLVNIPPPEWG